MNQRHQPACWPSGVQPPGQELGCGYKPFRAQGPPPSETQSSEQAAALRPSFYGEHLRPRFLPWGWAGPWCRCAKHGSPGLWGSLEIASIQNLPSPDDGARGSSSGRWAALPTSKAAGRMAPETAHMLDVSLCPADMDEPWIEAKLCCHVPVHMPVIIHHQDRHHSALVLAAEVRSHALRHSHRQHYY